MKDRVEVKSGGVFLPLLAVLFIGLKLTGYIGWSWWWVLAPIWLPAAFVIVVFIFIVVIAVSMGSVSALTRR